MRIEWPKASSRAACPVCDAPGPHPVLLRTIGPAHTLVRCDGCTGCFFERRDPPDYSADAPSELFLQLYVEQNAGLHHMSRFLFAIDNDRIDSMLDFGCGFGFPVDVADKVLNWRAVGIDPSHYATDGARLLGADIRREYLTEATDLGEPFGLLLGSEVIEHIPDLYPFMALLRRHMRPGGCLVLTTPDAGSLSPSVGDGMLTAMLSVGAHLVLFTAQSMEVMLRRAGFAHVHTEVAGYNLVAYASDQPLRFRADREERHFRGYQAYLRRLLDTAEPGGALWNGAAGRLFALDVRTEPVEALHALFARVSDTWRDRFGIDLARLRLPAPLAETEFGTAGPVLLERLRAAQPLNLAGLLYNRALLERRMPGHLPERVLEFARAAFTVAQQTCRVLQEFGLIDYDLNLTTWRARIVCVDCLALLAPELEGSLLASLAAASQGRLAERIDPPPDVVIARLAPFFSDKVHRTEYDEAMRLEPWLRDLDALCAATRGDQKMMHHLLFTVGVLRLNRMQNLGGAMAAFQRMQAEAETELHDPARAALAGHFLPVARQHADHVRALLAAAGAAPASKRRKAPPKAA